ncbi:hypothetical protein [Vibrio gallicus]|uniref:hypothetical protein n=1 Tax=Vibrio gallicus TaxID=190897 RepID=UPI0021C3E826|nr:hypothetical protein [Vibrio gallicus]
MNNKNVIALAIAGTVLVGCNSDSDSNSNSTSNPGDNPENSTFTVIDGYINNAFICARETVEEACAYTTTTDVKGQFSLPPEYADMLITADIVGGLSSDSDTLGVSAHSYTMIAVNTEQLITPFTSIAKMSDLSVEDIASEIGVTVEELTSDYVASDDTKVHLYARTLASQLNYKSVEDASKTLMSVVKETKSLIEQLEQDHGSDFDFSTITVDIEIDYNGNVNASSLPRVSNLSDFLEISKDSQSLPIYSASLNPSYFDQEGIFLATFKDGATTSGNETWKYEIDGLQLIFEDGEVDEFIYVSNHLALGVVTGDKDLNIYAQQDLITNGKFTENELVGKTLYFVADDSTGVNPDPMFAELKFEETSVTITEGVESFSVGYEISSDTGALHIRLSEESVGDNDMVMYRSLSNQHMLIGFDQSTQTFVLNFYDKAFAEKIYQDWSNLASSDNN